MARHLIVAVDVETAEHRYFLGYRDRGEASECLWTTDRWQALWLDADEAGTEAELLALLCPSQLLHAQPVGVTQDDS
ncbi:hypothetical protein [Roseicella aerolata]|uniref:Uncharacterized protein n=1 Tax=Roseicella aerolata TaxID=2883479 RepID=A0A9X1L8M5_9PROT|nr:hypothetical protein [Roseicella aerolata]MCB4820480.1 hypothetical protein [Roseicella aerolata]